MFNTLQLDTQKRLASLAERIYGIEPEATTSLEFTISMLLERPESLLTNAETAFKRAYPYIYCISASNDDNLQETRIAFMEAKAQEKRDRAYARLNGHTSRCFYVGSSCNLAKRMKEHFGFGASSTYSLQLAHWADGFPELKLTMHAAMYPSDTDSEIIQALEDTLWESHLPMFGKKGGK
ncbi:GIY-YIG catalytic domain protein [compost metagenome]